MPRKIKTFTVPKSTLVLLIEQALEGIPARVKAADNLPEIHLLEHTEAYIHEIRKHFKIRLPKD